MQEDFFRRLAERVIEQLPPEDRFSQHDAETIAKHRDFLLALEGDLVGRFYDTLFFHPITRAVFHEGERPTREESLRRWWRRTLEGPFDLDYWAWQARVGLLHVRRGVTNAMMLGHAGLVQRVVMEKAKEAQDEMLAGAISRLMSTVASIIAEGYHKVYLDALCEITGQSEELVQRSVQVALEGL